MSRNTTFLPRTDSGLLAWSAKLSQKISADPEVYGLDPSQCEAFASTQAEYALALKVANAPESRTKISVMQKNVVRESLRNAARLINSIVKGQADVTDAQKLALGLTVPAQKTTVPVPADVPLMIVVSVIGRTVRVKFLRREGEGRAWPDGVQGVSIFSFAGSELKVGESVFQFEKNTTGKEVDLHFPPTLPRAHTCG